MKIINIKLLAFAAAGILVLGSCKKDFLDVNTNPNNAEDVTVDLILPSAQGYLAYDVGLHFQIAGSFFSQYVTQGSAGSQYATYDQYRLSAVDFNRPWIDQYAGSLNDFEVIKAKSVIVLSDPKTSQGEKDKASNYAAIANLMQAYSFQVLADAYGDIPISAALKGQGNLSPKYDAQALVYDSLIKIVNRGISLIKDESDFHPGNDDLIYGGDMTAWKDFGNTLKLKIYLRQSGIRTDVARAGIEGMQAEGVSFLTTTAQVNFITTKFNTNPLYSNVASLGNFNLTASTTALDLFDSLADPRVQYFYVPASEGTFLGQFRGAVQGSLVNNTGAIQSASEFAQPSFNTGNAPVNASDEELEIAKTAPVILMSAAESYFLQAEAANAGFLTSPASEAYEAGITESFTATGFADSATNYIAKPNVALIAGDQAANLDRIMTQKYLAMTNTQNFESWCEVRRTKLPAILIDSKASLQAPGARVERLPYPESEQSQNPNFPGLAPIITKLWWAK